MPCIVIFLTIFDNYIVDIIESLNFISAIDILNFLTLVLNLVILFIFYFNIILIIFSKSKKHQLKIIILTNPHILLDFSPHCQSSQYLSSNNNF